ncbi:hypothetical protein KFL_001850090 [Klebsormidium nitens]|uniref:Uncharacterized protein n=1 Tax=Klebsormidium nitens TaxID=105231 RepID=A0A1Y1I092_KLENI|nr:hypothetical protein KFL_001850090 [Klebsormidium nitens]|eukprot:GAQ84334.1 hypothetical protein KFL_001850090 [Klebsormidium nitens]
MTGPSAYKVPMTHASRKKPTGKAGGSILRQLVPINGAAPSKVHPGPEGPCRTLIWNASQLSLECGALDTSGSGAQGQCFEETDDRNAKAGPLIQIDAIAAQTERDHLKRLTPDRTETANGHEGSARFELGSSDSSSHRERVASASAGSDNPSSSQPTCHTGLAASDRRSFAGQEIDAPVPLKPLLDESGRTASPSQGSASASRTDDCVAEDRRLLQDDARRWDRAENLTKKIKRRKAKTKLRRTELAEEVS